MNAEERNHIFNDLFADMTKLTTTKGHDYSGDKDVLDNFKRNANNLGLTAYQVWSVYFNKHIDAINTAIKDCAVYPQDSSEPFEERCKDAMVYLALCVCLRREQKAIADAAAFGAMPRPNQDEESTQSHRDSLDRMNDELNSQPS